MKKIDKRVIITILLPIFTIMFIMGLTSYALYYINLQGTTTINTETFDVSLTYNEPANALISTSIGMSTAEGKRQTNYFEFTVSSTGRGTFVIPYNIYITKNAANTMSNDAVNIYLTEVVSGAELPVLEATKVSLLPYYTSDTNTYFLFDNSFSFSSTTSTTITRTYRIRVWNDAISNTTTTANGQTVSVEAKTFNYTINVDTLEKTSNFDKIPPSLCYTTSTNTISEFKCYEGNEDGYQGYKNVIVPANVGQTAITGIGEYAYAAKRLEFVTISSGITTISVNAFSNNFIKNITFPTSVTSIDADAFAFNDLRTVIIPSGSSLTAITGIGADAFSISSEVETDFVNNPYLTKIYNNSGKAFNWGTATTMVTTNDPFVTGTLDDGNIVITTGP